MEKNLPEIAVVPVAGLGTRLLPITKAVPKELLPLGGLPTLHYIATELASVGVRKIILVSSQRKSEIANYFSLDQALSQSLREKNKHEILQTLWTESEHSDVEFEVVIQHEQRGLGHAILCARQSVPNQPIIVALGDCVMGLGGKSTILQDMVEVHQSKQADIVIAFEKVPDEKVSRYGIAAPESTDSLESVFGLSDVVEKPNLDQAPSNLAVAARYILPPKIFDVLNSIPAGKDGEIQLTDAIRNLIFSGAKAFGVRLPEGDRRYDVGNIQSYTEAFVQFAMADPELRTQVNNAINQFDNNATSTKPKA